MLLELHPENPNIRDLKKVLDILHKDGVIIIPTDTIYAMACKLDSKKAIERMARISGKKSDKVNFSLICSDLSNISDYTAHIDRSIFRLLKNNLPGPFTFILKANNNVTKYFSSSKKTIGIRVPDNAIAQTIIRELGIPLVVTSIIHDDEILEYMTDPEEIYNKYEHQVDCVIDGGAGGNIPSTIVNCSNDELEVIREGKGVLIH
ncbi:MAG: threonylcarbamoyl-AMP synthase [Bacteroidia bacterium]|jgi:tRNA threonylcarbamoyl adenosine modification protein (Sua5/YciO/YrdC/YwlC family)|nr:threonylcarbamoyl-AMP synthase [Bacteroidia bacterium]MBP9689436.1 threonylcarbamoyl-AMP synthase [Bacteroidia bacterium]